MLRFVFKDVHETVYPATTIFRYFLFSLRNVKALRLDRVICRENTGYIYWVVLDSGRNWCWTLLRRTALLSCVEPEFLCRHGVSARPTPPRAAMMTTTNGGAFHAVNRTKQASASAKSAMSPMAPVNTGA